MDILRLLDHANWIESYEIRLFENWLWTLPREVLETLEFKITGNGKVVFIFG